MISEGLILSNYYTLPIRTGRPEQNSVDPEHYFPLTYTLHTFTGSKMDLLKRSIR